MTPRTSSPTPSSSASRCAPSRLRVRRAFVLGASSLVAAAITLASGSAASATSRGLLQVSAMVQDSCNVVATLRGPGEAPEVTLRCDRAGATTAAGALLPAVAPAVVRTETRGRLEIVEVMF